jgi:hypothetical protein
MAAKKSGRSSSKPVIVRAYSGVFFGYEKARRGSEIDLIRVRQIWQWQSTGLATPVRTCGDIALRGVGTGSRISDETPAVTVLEVKAIFVCTPEAERVLREASWAK